MPAPSTSARVPTGPRCHASSPIFGVISAESATIRRSFTIVGVIAAAGALVSCGGSRPQTTTQIPPPSVPLPKVTRPTKPPPISGGLQWPTYGANNARLRAVGAPGLRPPFRRLWTFHGGGLLEFPPAVGYGSVFEEAFHGRLSSIDPATGRTR